MGKNKKTGGHKFTLRQFIWNGFNLTVAVAFLGSLSILASNHNGEGSGLGWHMIWIFGLMSVVVGVCAFAFAKLSRFHQQDNNGGAYIYTRSALGKFVGLVVGMLNYIIIPLVFSNQILMFVKANFDPSMSVPPIMPKDATAWWANWTQQLHGWRFLIYDAIGIALTVAFSAFAFFGSKIYKKAGNYSLIVKWVTSGFFIAFAIAAIFFSQNSGNATDWANNSKLTFSGFASAFSACFYYFTGFEIFATAGKNLEKPEKNLGKGIVWVIVLSGLFYVALTTIYMLAVAPGKTTQNINTGFWTTICDVKGLHWLIFAGPIIMIVATIAMRGNTIAQLSLYGGTSLQPLSQEGYISTKFNELNSQHFPIKAMKLNVIIISIVIGTWMVIPDLVNGFTNGKANFINVNTIISAASSFYIFLYIIVLIVILKYTFNSYIKTNFCEKIAYMLVLAILAVIYCYHYYEIINTVVNDPSLKNIVATGVEFMLVLGFILFVTLTYTLYYKPRLAKRMKDHPAHQIQLDYEFRLMDGWSYFKRKYAYMYSAFVKKEKRRAWLRKRLKLKKHDKDVLRMKAEWRKQLFIDKMERKILWEYMVYSKHTLYYNNKRHIDVKREVARNHRDARKVLVSGEKLIHQPLAS